MSDQSKTFNISERFLAERRRLFAVFGTTIGATIAALGFLWTLAMQDFDLKRVRAGLWFLLIPLLIPVSIVLGFLLEFRSWRRHWRQLSLHVGPEGLALERSRS